MTFETIHSQEYIEKNIRLGYWPNRTICDYLDDITAKHPEKEALVDKKSRYSYGQIKEITDRMALGFLELGIEKGDVVSFQLPNWNEFIFIYLALCKIGAVSNPIIPIYRASEVRFMVNFLQSKIMIIPSEFRKFSYTEMMEELRKELPSLQRIMVLGKEIPKGMHSFQDFMETPWEKKRDLKELAGRRPGPNEVNEIIFTSGTTGEPKGVMHTQNTILTPLLAVSKALEFTDKDVILMSSTFGHQTGWMYGVNLPLLLGAKGVYLDIWEPREALTLIRREGVTFTMGATPFLSDLTYSPHLNKEDVRSLRIFIAAGAAIPRQLVRDARQNLNCAICAGWGMTENALVTVNKLNDPEEKICETDGYPLPGMEIKVIDEQGDDLLPGSEGDLLCRGPFTFAGYYKRPQFNKDSFWKDGWFKTGDRAVIDREGYLAITGRSKDIIIRGGENIPVAEVENILYKHPKINNVTIVAMPDERFQEKACAFVILKEGEHLTFQEMIAYLETQAIAKQKYPERLEIIQEFPMTPSGKIQKFKLRERITELLKKGKGENR
ncbi:MAG: AMP-binding protein [Candidatus Tectomicrobia bacterium]|uniref:AMP-binding protein n=1 Tax=Tectimicrobiota bacterium TaxID=2528274 RepID=A0A933GKW1_UNCTE|nr:AMP-binding protein [Candidatus Tectomicrobia bacterium]